MIISASRRTDIPAFYSGWFFNRLYDGYVLVRNPMNYHQIGKIDLSPDVVDGIVFWTKNPLPMMSHLSELKKYNFYFQFTITAYGKDVEPNIPSKKDIIIPAFQELSKRIGKERVIWRYDPIFLNNRYTMEYHCRYFRVLSEKICAYTKKCTVSFLDLYRNTVRNTQPLGIIQETKEQQIDLLIELSKIAREHGLILDTCSEAIDLCDHSIEHARCIDKVLLEKMGKCKLIIGKDQTQRSECGCVESIDIGAYNTCRNGCLYCYANFSPKTVAKNTLMHNPCSPLLFGEIGQNDIIKERKVTSFKDNQLTLFND